LSASISIDEFCGLERITRPTWYRMIAAGTAPIHYHIGSGVRIAYDDYERWREARKAAE
jgi:excisionase family DNA binding protein